MTTETQVSPREPPPAPIPDATMVDQVLPVLLGAKYLLERLEQCRAQDRPWTTAEVTDVAAMLQHLAAAAEVLHAWWMQHNPDKGGV